jgi:hypothetical protein
MTMKQKNIVWIDMRILTVPNKAIRAGFTVVAAH